MIGLSHMIRGSHMIGLSRMIGGVSYDRPLSSDKGGLI